MAWKLKIEDTRCAEKNEKVCELRISTVSLEIPGFGFRVSGFGFRVSGYGFRVSGFGFRVSGFGFRVSNEKVCELRISTASRDIPVPRRARI